MSKFSLFLNISDIILKRINNIFNSYIITSSLKIAKTTCLTLTVDFITCGNTLNSLQTVKIHNLIFFKLHETLPIIQNLCFSIQFLKYKTWRLFPQEYIINLSKLLQNNSDYLVQVYLESHLTLMWHFTVTQESSLHSHAEVHIRNHAHVTTQQDDSESLEIFLPDHWIQWLRNKAHTQRTPKQTLQEASSASVGAAINFLEVNNSPL